MFADSGSNADDDMLVEYDFTMGVLILSFLPGGKEVEERWRQL